MERLQELSLQQLGALVTVPTTLAILGGNSVAGRALEALLQDAGYDTRLIEDYPTSEPKAIFEGVKLLLITPTPSDEARESSLADMRNTPGAAAIPVLTLSTSPKEDLRERSAFISWPCRIEDLTEEIEAALHPELGVEEAS